MTDLWQTDYSFTEHSRPPGLTSTCWLRFLVSGSPATVRGTLLQEGWGAAVGYPGIVLDEHGGEVHGFIFSSEELSAYWARLDEFEGDGYERVVALVELGDGTVVKAHVYALKGNNSIQGPTSVS